MTNIQYSPLQTAILTTLAYFDIFEFPLTSTEVYKYLWNKGNQKYNISEIISELNNLCINNQLVSKNGLYCLYGRVNNISTRLIRYALSFKKINIAAKIIKIFSFIPFIKLIAICNSLSYRNSKTESDIDLFIIVKKNRLWLTRLLTVFIIKMLNLRPQPKDRANKICLCFFLSETNLNIQNMAIVNPDVYLIYWLKTLYPVWERDQMYTKFLAANNWIYAYVQKCSPEPGANLLTNPIKASNYILDTANKIAKKIQLRIIPEYLKKTANQNTNIIINDNILKFHINDRREQYRQNWLSKLKELNL